MVSKKDGWPALLLFFVCGAFGCPACTQVNLSDSLSNDSCSDDFNRADSERVGGNWNMVATYAQNPAPQIGIANGKAQLSIPATGKGTGMLCKNRLEQTKSKITILATAPTVATNGSKLLLVGREQDLLNTYTCGFEYTKTQMQRTLGGVNGPTVTNNTAITGLTANSPLEIIFETYGSSLTCTVKHAGNTAQLTMTDATFVSGSAGLYSDSANGPLTFLIDDFKVEIPE
jgi:hypothetical protein